MLFFPLIDGIGYFVHFFDGVEVGSDQPGDFPSLAESYVLLIEPWQATEPWQLTELWLWTKPQQ